MLRKARKPHKAKVLVGLSGGVDSAVSAYLLQEAGFEVEGVFMKNWSSTAGLKVSDCPWLADRQEALRVAAFLGIPLHTVDFEREYEAHVMRYFFAEYKAGRTPNPDVMCNKEIKFKVLYKWAMKQGFDYLATGHYARIGKSKNTKKRSSSDVQSITYNLLRSADEFKDQTYFIYNIKTGQLPHLLFPIGGMKKTAVKKLAKRIGLPNAARKESIFCVGETGFFMSTLYIFFYGVSSLIKKIPKFSSACRMLELTDRLGFNLSDTLTCDFEFFADFLKCLWFAIFKSESHEKYSLFTR
jgi:tRNA-specific 2-thiouridylase